MQSPPALNLPFDPSNIISAHDKYTRLIREYQAAKQAYEFDNSDENYDRLQEAMQRLKRQGEVIEDMRQSKFNVTP